MQEYIGVKALRAKPMTKAQYNKLRGWEAPKDGSREGYLVEYLGSNEKIHTDYDNYISWSPREVFEDAYVNINEDVYSKLVDKTEQLLKKHFIKPSP